MIRVDRRVGSVELAGPLKALGAPVRICTLNYGDAAFLGKGPEGMETIGIERKTLSDLLASALQTRRFFRRQLPGLIQDYSVRYLLVEGPYRPARDGLLESGKLWSWNGARDKSGVTWTPTRHTGRMMYRDLDGLLSSIQELGGITIVRTLTTEETVHWIHSRYSWWSKRWSDHKSLQPVWKELCRRDRDPRKDDHPEALRYTKASVFRKMIAQIPCIGWVRSAAVETYFQSWDTLMAAPAKEWCQIPGIGPVIARTAWRELHASTPELLGGSRGGPRPLSPDARRGTPRSDRG